MQDFVLNKVKANVAVYAKDNHLKVIFVDEVKNIHQSYNLDVKHYNKLKSYKSVSALLKYAKANALPSPTLAMDLSSETVASEGNPSPVADDVTNPVISDTPIFISVKTTGHGHNDEIIDLAIVDSNEKILFESLFKTTTPNRVFENTHLSIMSRNNTFDGLWNKIHKIIKGKKIVAYHLPFVQRMIANSVCINFKHDKRLTFEQILPNQQAIGLMYDYAKFYGDYGITGLPKNQSLNEACYQSNIPIGELRQYHQRARHDAIKTARLYRFMQAEGVF